MANVINQSRDIDEGCTSNILFWPVLYCTDNEEDKHKVLKSDEKKYLHKVTYVTYSLKKKKTFWFNIREKDI